jgi:hypothetical protein
MDVPRSSKPERRDRCSRPAPTPPSSTLVRMRLFQSCEAGSSPAGGANGFNRIVGWVERSETHQWPVFAHDGFRFAQPILLINSLESVHWAPRLASGGTVKRTAGSVSGRPQDFESCCGGSIPSPAARRSGTGVQEALIRPSRRDRHAHERPKHDPEKLQTFRTRSCSKNAG